MSRPKGMWTRVAMLAVGGALGFWVANFAISLTPIAAEYRAALSIAYVPMLLEALFGGLIIGVCVSYFLIRFFNELPTRSPMSKSVMLSLVALVLVTALIEVPSKAFATTGDPFWYFLYASLFNVLRVLALGVVIGYLYERVGSGMKD